MLGKVFKHEMKSSSRLFLPMMAGFLAITLLTKLSFETSNMMDFGQTTMNMIAGIFMTLYFVYAVALFVMTSVFIVILFYKTMVSEQGYLTHTLPVKTSTLINAKILSAILWQLSSFILFFLSIMIFFTGHVDIEDINWMFDAIKKTIEYTIQSPNILITAASLILWCIVSIVYTPLMMYASIALGHLFNKHRVLLAIVAYFVIHIAIQIISTIALGLLGSAIYMITDSANYIINNYLLFGSLFSICCSAAFYAVTNYIFSRKLNLE